MDRNDLNRLRKLLSGGYVNPMSAQNPMMDLNRNRAIGMSNANQLNSYLGPLLNITSNLAAGAGGYFYTPKNAPKAAGGGQLLRMNKPSFGMSEYRGENIPFGLPMDQLPMDQLPMDQLPIAPIEGEYSYAPVSYSPDYSIPEPAAAGAAPVEYKYDTSPIVINTSKMPRYKNLYKEYTDEENEAYFRDKSQRYFNIQDPEKAKQIRNTVFFKNEGPNYYEGAASGIRNNNPGNTRPGDWIRDGAIGLYYQGDEYELMKAGKLVDKNGKPRKPRTLMVYNDVRDGIYDMWGLVRKHIRDGEDTIYKLIRKYLGKNPEDKNDPVTYIQHVSEWTGIKPHQKLDYTNMDQMIAILNAIAAQENSVDISSYTKHLKKYNAINLKDQLGGPIKMQSGGLWDWAKRKTREARESLQKKNRPTY